MVFEFGETEQRGFERGAPDQIVLGRAGHDCEVPTSVLVCAGAPQPHKSRSQFVQPVLTVSEQPRPGAPFTFVCTRSITARPKSLIVAIPFLPVRHASFFIMECNEKRD